MRLTSGLKLAFVLTLTVAAATPARAQWATPTLDGYVAPGEYGANNQLDNAGNTGQTWYITWDASNLYVGIVNANLAEGAVIYIAGNPQRPPTCCINADGNLSGFNYDGTGFSSLPFRATFVTYVKDGYREYRNSDGSGGWSGPTADYGTYASNAGNSNTREVAIPWNAITSGGGLPTSFVFFGYLTSSGGYIYGQAPADSDIGAFAGTNIAATQYYSVVNTGDGTSTPPFSDEQPSASPPPPPTITTTPANPTNHSTGIFTFSDTQADVTFQCALDNGAFSTCASPQTYPIATEGRHTFAVEAVNSAHISSAAASFTWLLDTTPPTITYSGNTGTYTVDQTVKVTCTAMDNPGGSGLASSTCANISGPAYSFKLGANTYNATATDNAGNVGVGSVTFTVKDTTGGLGHVVSGLETKPAVAAVMEVTLLSAEAAFKLGARNLGDLLLTSFIAQVNAQEGKSLTAAQAATLIGLATALEE